MLERVENSVRRLLQENEALQTPGNCRNAVSKIAEHLKKEDQDLEISFLVYPKAESGFGVHYSLLVKKGKNRILINTIEAPGFPIFIGDLKKAHPNFRAMNEVSEVT